MEFRELTINDSAAIIPLAHKLRPAADPAQLSGYLAEMFDYPTFHCFGLRQGGKLIAVSFGWITVRFYSGKQLEVDNVIVETLDRAVAAAANDAEASSLAAPVVLLSPACASFDQYPNFEVRGDKFRELVRAIPGLLPQK